MATQGNEGTMTTYLVTGGAGFIGSAIVHALAAAGNDVRVLDDLSTGYRRNLDGAGDRVELIVGSITDPAALAEALVGARFVLHQAAVVSVTFSVSHPYQTHQINVGGTEAVLRGAAEAGVQRVVIASSCAVYGEPAAVPVHEGLEPYPRSPYAESKLGAEQAARQASGVEAVALRYFNVYGPRQDPASAYAAVVPLFVQAHLAREPVTLHGDGRQTRDFCFVQDVVRANLTACTASGAAGKAFNVGTGVETSLLDLLAGLRRQFGHGVEVRPARERPGDLRRSCASVERARDTLGFEARTALDEGLAATVEWCRSGS